MRRTLIVEALVDASGGTLLHQITTILREHQLNPETFVWCFTPPGNLVTVHLALQPEDNRWMPAINDLLKDHPAVHRVNSCDMSDFRNRLSHSLQIGIQRTPG